MNSFKKWMKYMLAHTNRRLLVHRNHVLMLLQQGLLETFSGQISPYEEKRRSSVMKDIPVFICSSFPAENWFQANPNAVWKSYTYYIPERIIRPPREDAVSKMKG